MKLLLLSMCVFVFKSYGQRVKPPSSPIINSNTVSKYGISATTSKIVFIRSRNFANSLMNCAVFINNEKKVAMKNNAYYYFPIKPSKYSLSWKGKEKRSLELLK
jgi:hypothetical protein